MSKLEDGDWSTLEDIYIDRMEDLWIAKQEGTISEHSPSPIADDSFTAIDLALDEALDDFFKDFEASAANLNWNRFRLKCKLQEIIKTLAIRKGLNV